MIHQKKFRFKSVEELRDHLVNEFEDLIMQNDSFDVGFMEGSQQAKVWLENSEDLDRMYKLYPKGGNITFWCYSAQDTVSSSKRKRDEISTRRQDKEEEVDKIFKELREKHGKLECTKLRLWARMICGGLHDDYDEPPDMPAFNPDRKRPRRESLTEAFTGAATAICKVLSPHDPPSKGTESSLTGNSSPSKVITLRMKNYEQLKYLKQLNDDGVLNDKEYIEQKNDIMMTLRKL